MTEPGTSPSAQESAGATYLAVPDAGDLVPPTASGVSLPAWAVVGMMGLVMLGAVMLRRRQRSIDPAERAFRRISRAAGLPRREIKALRRAARAMGLDSPVGLALCPTQRQIACERYHAHNSRR